MKFRQIFILAAGFILIASGVVWSQAYNTSGGWFDSDARRATSTTDHLGLGVAGDTAANDRFQLRADGQMSWGSGSAVPDVDLARTAANVLGLPAGDRFNAPLFGDASGDDTLNIGGTDDEVTFDSNDGAGEYNCTDADANANCAFAGGGTGTATLGATANTSAAIITDGGTVTIDGYVQGRVLVVSSASGALTMNAVNLATAGATDHDVPDATCAVTADIGTWFTVVVEDASTVVEIQPLDTSNILIVEGLAQSAGEEVDSCSSGTENEGCSITFTCLATDQWYATAQSGTWAVGGAAD